IILDVPVGHKEVLPSVVVVIEEERAEGQIVQARRPYPAGNRIVPVERCARLVVEGGLLSRKVRNDDAALTLVVKVVDVNAHAGVRLPLLVRGDSHLHPYLLESVMA